MQTAAAPPDLSSVFQAEERFLWGLSYRLTGSAADADDVVQETFVRALERPPARTDEPWRPWLVRVALNLGRDLLRRRKRRKYDGPWLPSPIDTGAEADDDSPSAEARYEKLESVSYAFLLALEALTPLQRAVLLLRDVFDYSVAETARALSISEPNVKTTLHRARHAMDQYDRQRTPLTREHQERTRKALETFLAAIVGDDLKAIESLLRADARALSDGGGEFYAARRPLLGANRVARFYTNIAKRRGVIGGEWRMLNGLPAAVTRFEAGLEREAIVVVTRLDVGADGRISEVHSILATPKLMSLRRQRRFE